MRYAPLLFALLLTGCETSTPLAKCKGLAFGLNVEHWRPSSADLKACSVPAPASSRGSRS
jgi:type IV secretion system protein VirB7